MESNKALEGQHCPKPLTMNRSKPRNPFGASREWEVSGEDEVLTEARLAELITREKYDEKLPGYLHYWLGIGDSAQDISQDAWITILEKIRAGQTIYARGLFRYACRVAHGNFLNQLRKRRNKPEYPLHLIIVDTDTDEKHLLQLPISTNNLDANVKLFLEEVFTMLDSREQRIFELDRLGFDDAEIARKIGIEVDNLRVIRHRALSKLRQFLTQGVGKKRAIFRPRRRQKAAKK